MEKILKGKKLEKIKDPEMWLTLVKRVLIIIGFIFLCQLDQVINSATGQVQHALRNYTGVAIAVFALCAYHPKDFLKIPYALWAVLFFTGRHFVLQWAQSNVGNLGQFESTVWNVGIYGILFIRMFYRFVIERKKPAMNWPVFGIWAAMMAGMLLSRNDEIWHRWFFLWFGVLYLTDYSEMDLDTLFTGMSEGIIIGFLLTQTRACMHRPYDVLRYTGMQSNSNTSALYYAVVYCAVLCKWYQMKLKHRRLILRLPFLILCGVLYSLAFFTMGRTALITMILVTLLFLVFQVLSRKRYKFREFLLDGAAILLSAVVCFVPTFWLVRYIPAYVNDPIYFEADNEETKVHKDDPIDSEKYIELEDVLKGAFGRILWFMDFSSKETSRLFRPSLVVYAAETTDIMESEEEPENPLASNAILPGTDKEHPMLGDQDKSNPVKIRTSIYRYYLKHLNLNGHTLKEHGVWISETYLAPHAHNVLLQMAYNYGIPVGCLFIIMIALVYIVLVHGIRTNITGRNYYYLLCMGGFTTVFFAFGTLEISWNFGQISLAAFFLALYCVCHRGQT